MGIQSRVLLLISFLLAPSGAFAGDHCQAVDLRRQIGAPWHQGNSGLCFAHAAASLIEARLGIRVSPLDLGTHYLLRNENELDPRLVPPMVRAHTTTELLKYWRDDLRSETEYYDADKILGEEGLVGAGGDELPTLLVANYFGLCPNTHLPTGEKVYEGYLASIQEYHRKRSEAGIDPAEGELPIGEVQGVESRMKARSFRQWVASRCREKFRPWKPLLPVMFRLAPNLKALRAQALLGKIVEGGRAQLQASIDESLNRGDPVTIGYALGDLLTEESRANAEQVDHASVLAGRRRIGKHCYYFLRNSFGNDLSGYRKQFAGRLEDGGVWLRLDEIPSLYSAIWLR